MFACVACKCAAPIVPVKSCLTGIPMNIPPRNGFVWIATVLCITKVTELLLFCSTTSAHMASPLEQVGTGVGSDTDFLGLPLSNALFCGPVPGLCTSVGLLRNRWRTAVVGIKSASPCKWQGFVDFFERLSSSSTKLCLLYLAAPTVLYVVWALRQICEEKSPKEALSWENGTS